MQNGLARYYLYIICQRSHDAKLAIDLQYPISNIEDKTPCKLNMS